MSPDFWVILTGILAAASCGLIGAFLVLRQNAMLGDAISHAVLPGLVIAFLVTSSRNVLPMIIGAFIGRFGCRKWFGDKWPQYRIVFAAGFGAGVGLITMVSLGVVFMTKSANVLPI